MAFHFMFGRVCMCMRMQLHPYYAISLIYLHLFSCCGYNCLFSVGSFVCSCFKNYYCLLFRLAYHVHILARYITVCILIYLRLKNYGYII